MIAELHKHPTTIASRLTEELTHAIVTGGGIAAGEKISEPDLAGRYEVSRGPLREAIRRLEGRGLVRHIPHAGVRVVTLEHNEVVELYAIREVLEGMAARLAAENMSETEIKSVRKLLDEHEAAVQKSKGRDYFQQEGDLDFHYRIVVASGNKKLTDLLCGELYHLVRMYRYRSSRTVSRPQQALEEHRRILDAIAERDGELSELLMRRHLSRARQSISTQLEKPND
ncbi:MAG: GntR family transcriptional regulator [Candidatus Rariloculaceae bacterium]